MLASWASFPCSTVGDRPWERHSFSQQDAREGESARSVDETTRGHVRVARGGLHPVAGTELAGLWSGAAPRRWRGSRFAFAPGAVSLSGLSPGRATWAPGHGCLGNAVELTTFCTKTFPENGTRGAFSFVFRIQSPHHPSAARSPRNGQRVGTRILAAPPLEGAVHGGRGKVGVGVGMVPEAYSPCPTLSV